MEIDGQLTLLGVTRPVTLKVDRRVYKDPLICRKMPCGGNVSGAIKRSELGMKHSIPSNSDKVRLSGMFLGFRD
jgi:polyisoprenoid-binding protein YceI